MYPYSLSSVALFGGSFNPPHSAHIELAKYAVKRLKLDLLVFIPAFKSVDKLNLDYLAGSDSLELLSLLSPSYSTVTSDFELSSGKPLQSMETVSHFSSLFSDSELFFLFGDDHLESLHTWEELEELFSISTPVVFSSGLKQSVEKPSTLSEELFSKLLFLDNQYFPHSSTECSKNPNSSFLDKSVKSYISKTSV